MSETPLEIFLKHTQKRGLKSSRQRELIVTEFFRKHAHVSAEELLKQVRKRDVRVSVATLYRTLKLLQECGLVQSHHFGDDSARFESTLHGGEHHDHLICLRCSRIVEFFNEEIESLQKIVAEEHRFEIEHHRMELYGVCPQCQEKNDRIPFSLEQSATKRKDQKWQSDKK